jgi:hypothetical protein
MEQNIINQMSDLIKTAETVAFNPATNSVCILTPRINGNALSFKNMCYKNCTRAEIEYALDASGMNFSNRPGRNGLVMFEILSPSSQNEGSPASVEMSLQEALSSLPWMSIIVDANQITLYCYNSNLRPLERHWQTTFSQSKDSVNVFWEHLENYAHRKEDGPRGLAIVVRQEYSLVKEPDETLSHD